MLTGRDLSLLLHAVSTSYSDRALSLITTVEGVDDAVRKALYAAVSERETPSEQAQALGDALRSAKADQNLINECYRCAFYLGRHWIDLADNPMFAWFAANRAGPVVDKWIHYFPIYARHLAQYRGRPVRVLEIGTYRGGGLQLLQHYLGPSAELVGLDIDEAAAHAVNGRFPVVLGDQADPAVLRDLSAKYGPFDIVIDDGGHTMAQQIAAVQTLFPLLADRATYIVEDTHTSYWDEFGGGPPGTPGTLTSWVRERVDDLHARHCSDIDLDTVWATQLDGIHVYDSIAVLDKEQRFRPFNEVAGSSSYLFGDRVSELLPLEMLATRDAAIAERDQVRDATLRQNDELAQLRDDLRVLRAEIRHVREGEVSARSTTESLQEELERTRGMLLESWRQVKAMRATVSWRVTRPLRWVRRGVR